MYAFFSSLFASDIFLSAVGASVIAQLIKTALDTVRDRRFNWRSLFRGAGMPSSHTATVVGLSAAMWQAEGPTPLFFATFIFSCIVIRDVMGDKVFAVHQEKILNDFIEEVTQGKPVQWQHLTGHTAVEVVAGFFVGLAVAGFVCL